MGDSPTMMSLRKLFRPRQNESTGTSEEDQLSAFLAPFPTQLRYTKPPYYFMLWVFWSQNEGFQNNSSSGNRRQWVIHDMIRSSFYKFEVTLYNFDGLIQFWAPVNSGGRLVLKTSDQPFAVSDLNTGLEKFRLCSLNYQYNIDINKLEVEDDPTILSGAPASAFLNHLPEVVLDLKAHQSCPLIRSALECELMAYIVLPICDPSQSCCVGVVECFMRRSDCSLVIFNVLNAAVEGVGLSTFDVQGRFPYKSIDGLKHAKNDIDEALKIVCASHNLVLAQVWIPYEDETHVGFSSFEKNQTKPTFALKLTGLNGCFGWSYNYYFNACNKLALRIGEGLAGKTLQNHAPHFCKNISKLSNPELLVSFTADTKCSYFAICLRSINTCEFDYVFEFLWPTSRNYLVLLESLVLTIKTCLPNFKFASGFEFGEELQIQDVENSTGGEMGHFYIFQGNKLSKIPTKEKSIARSEVKMKTTTFSLARKDIEQQFGTTMTKAAKSLNVSLSTLKRKCKVLGISEWPGANFVKRKISDSNKDQRDINEEDDGAIVDYSTVNGDTYFDEDTLTIKAEYENDIIKFHIPILLATFVALENEIGKKLKLDLGSFMLKYLDEDGDWIMLVSDQDMRECIRSSKFVNSTAIRVRVLPYVHDKYLA